MIAGLLVASSIVTGMVALAMMTDRPSAIEKAFSVGCASLAITNLATAINLLGWV
mgnify:CR=1 FL=1